MEKSTSSISNTISKGTIYEEMSMYQASLDDAASRLADGIRSESFSNERIRKGDEILETYQVLSDAMHGKRVARAPYELGCGSGHEAPATEVFCGGKRKTQRRICERMRELDRSWSAPEYRQLLLCP